MHKEYLIDWRLYTCGANGQIYSYYWKKYLSGNISKYGYAQVELKCIDGKNRVFYWHRVIYTFFYGTIPDGLQVNHINENKTDNRLCNLNLMTPKENVNWGSGRESAAASRIGRKYSEETRMKIRKAHNKPVVAVDSDGNVVYEFESMTEAERHGFSQPHISRCCNGERKTHGGYRWYYKEDYLNEKESE